MARKKNEEPEIDDLNPAQESDYSEFVPEDVAAERIIDTPEDYDSGTIAGAPPDTLPYGLAAANEAPELPPDGLSPVEESEPQELSAQPEQSADIPDDDSTDKPPDEPPDDDPDTPPADEAVPDAPVEQATAPPAVVPDAKPARVRKKTIYDLKLNELDRHLSEDERREWSALYASYRSKSVLSGTVIGVDQTSFDIWNRDTGEEEKKTLTSLIVIDYRVKVLIPESEMWMPGEERPDFVMRNMAGSKIDYVIMEIDREGQCAIGSRRMAMAAKRHYFATARNGHHEGDLLKCRVMVAGAKRITVELGGYDIHLSQRDLSYAAIADLREKYHPGQELTCKLKEYDREAQRLVISVKEVKPDPFIGADMRHPIGSRRQAVISGKYAGGVFCSMPDDTVCLCMYSSQHNDVDFDIGDSVIITIRQYDYGRGLIFGRILAKWW